VGRALCGLSAALISRYPDVSKLRVEAARFFGVRKDELWLTNGADEAIYGLLSALIDDRQEVVMPDPSFSLYILAAKLQGAAIKKIALGRDFVLPLPSLLRSIVRRTRLVILASPHNPTGLLVRAGARTMILDKARQRGALVLLDETYAGFSGSWAGRLVLRHRNLVVVGSFSKFFGLAGLRLGYILACPEVLAELRKVLPPYSVNAAAIKAGQAALRAAAYQAGIRAKTAAEMRYLRAGLKRLGLRTLPSAANFLLADVGQEASRLHFDLASRGIRVRAFPGHPRLAGSLRLSVGRRKDNQRLLKEMARSLSAQALLFDMDGVLTDPSSSYLQAISKTIAHFLGKPVPPGLIEKWKIRSGFNNDWSVTAAILRSRGLQVGHRKIVSVFQQYLLGRNGNGLLGRERWLLPGPLVRRLNGRFKLAIVTGRPRREALFTLGRFSQGAYFSALIAREDMGRRQKPDPAGIRMALRQIKAGRAVYFGDSPDDMHAATAAGVLAVAVRPPRLHDRRGWERRMREAGAVRVLPSIRRLQKVLP
jgi:histidinol-phosphate aminotransferase